MRGKTAKLIRRVAAQTAEAARVRTETQYRISPYTGAYVMQPCIRQTIKFIKKNYKSGLFTNEELRMSLK